MYFIPQEAQEPAEAPPSAASTHPSAAPIEFEVEREVAPAELEAGPRMSSAAGLSGVFEMEPAAPPAVQAQAEAASAEEFERFSSAAPAEPQPRYEVAGAGATTIDHDFQIEEPLELVDELEADHHAAPAAETWSAPPAAISQPAFATERFDQAQPEAGIESVIPQPADVLPELASWDEPLPASPTRSSWATEEPSPEPEDGDPAPVRADPVWVAEETEIDPHESAISLHQQMQRGGIVDELLGSEAVAGPAVSAEDSPLSWEVRDPVGIRSGPPAEIARLSEAEILPEFEPNPYAAPAQPAELGSPDPYDSPDFPADLAAASRRATSRGACA